MKLKKVRILSKQTNKQAKNKNKNESDKQVGRGKLEFTPKSNHNSETQSPVSMD